MEYHAINSTPKCPACDSDNVKLFTSNPEDLEYFVSREVEARVLRCLNCQSLFQDPWPNLAETSTFYGPHYQNYAVSKVPLLSQMHYAQLKQLANEFITRFGQDVVFLDFGCGHGGFLQALQEEGCKNVYGYDFSPERPVGLPAEIGYFGSERELIESGQKFNTIRMNHVIEHLVDYSSTFTTLSEILKPGGTIFGQTPNAGHYSSGVMGKRWGNLHYPYHTLLFSERGMSAFASRLDLRLESTEKTMMPTGWAMGLENIVKAVFGWKFIGRTPIYTLCIFCAAPISIFERFAPFCRSNIFNFSLRKP